MWRLTVLGVLVFTRRDVGRASFKPLKNPTAWFCKFITSGFVKLPWSFQNDFNVHKRAFPLCWLAAVQRPLLSSVLRGLLLDPSPPCRFNDQSQMGNDDSPELQLLRFSALCNVGCFLCQCFYTAKLFLHKICLYVVYFLKETKKWMKKRCRQKNGKII